MTETLCTYYRKKCMVQELVNLQNVYENLNTIQLNDTRINELIELYPGVLDFNQKTITYMKQEPKVGDRKEVVRFAFYPMSVQGKMIWLKKYIAVKECKELIEWDEFAHEYYKTRYWKTIYWKTIKLKRNI